MHLMKEPLVSVVTPVYNGEKYIGECIESVLNQTYKNWEYIILNNCSTDHTLEIAENYQKTDKRIKVYSNTKFLPIMQNWNEALRKVSKGSRYCKVVHADDWIFPQCIEQLVNVAERHSSVGIVGSYGLKGNRVVSDGLPFPDVCISGRKVSRLALKMKAWPFPRPTALLIRSNLIRKKDKFYNEKNLHADHEICYEILKDHDFGFVHQVLSFMRVHEGSVSQSDYDVYGKLHYTNLALLKKFGPIFLELNEYEELLRKRFKKYYKFLALCLFEKKDKTFWEYQMISLRKLGCELSKKKLYLCLLITLINNPKFTIKKIFISTSSQLSSYIANTLKLTWFKKVQ
jgi:glycosyltransferase involved in cell wall biosynthesis